MDPSVLDNMQTRLPLGIIMRPCARAVLCVQSPDVSRWTRLVGNGKLTVGFELTTPTETSDEFRSWWFVGHPNPDVPSIYHPIAQSVPIPPYLWGLVKIIHAQCLIDLIVVEPSTNRFVPFLACLHPPDREFGIRLRSICRFAAVSQGPERDLALLSEWGVEPGEFVAETTVSRDSSHDR